ncbi:hypothetical protein Tco_0270452 [Tanacetum coccineum]
MSMVLFNRITEKQCEQHKEEAVSYDDLKASVDQYYDEYIAHKDQTDKLMEASMSSLDRSRTTISDLYKGLNVITQLLKEISNAVKDDPATNQKLNEATKTFARISSNVTEIMLLSKKNSSTNMAWKKSSTNMAWNLGSRMSGVELSQTALKREISSLRKDTSEIKSMMAEMYAAFQGYPSLAPSGSVTSTLALTDVQANVERENASTTTTKEPPSHTEGETEEPILKLVKASSIVRPGPDEPVKVEFIINGRKVYLTEQEIQDYWDKVEQIKKAEEEARLNAISKPEVIKVVREEAKKLGNHPKEAITTKAGELFKKAQDAEHEVLKRQHTRKVRNLLSTESTIKKIPEELRIHSALSAPAPEQASSRSSGRKRKHMKLEPETRIPGLECN